MRPIWPAGLQLPCPEPGRPGDPGLFGPGSAVWRIGRERVLLAGGPAALLLQVAHPLVAAGVAAHSRFRDRPLDRLRATLDATLRITFGDRDQALAAAEEVRAVHRRVRGVLEAPVGALPAGTPYRAEDPELAMWVHATLVATALAVYGRLVRPLGPAEREAYYREARRFAALFGATGEVVPPTLAAFRAYLVRMQARLAVGEQARDLARVILAPPVPRAWGAAGPALRAVTAALLPPALREGYGLRWGRAEVALARAVAGATRAALRVAPPAVRFWPHYAAALRRVGPGR